MQTAADSGVVDRNQERLTGARRIVVKVGSSLLVDEADTALNGAWLESLVDDVLRIRKRGQESMIVSSGAIVLGRRRLGFPEGRLKLKDSQAAAAVGRIELAAAYRAACSRAGLVAAQVLLTLDDTETRGRYLNARDTFNTLLARSAVPVINENDTVATGGDPVRR